MSRLVVFLILFCFGSVGQAQTDTALVRVSMQEQEQAWNRGDLRGFMSAYWNDERLMFIGSKGITYGWKSTLANYERSYNSPDKMGRLAFTILSLDRISADCIYVVGRWQLFRKEPVGGHFSLLWRKVGGKWLIVADHTS